MLRKLIFAIIVCLLAGFFYYKPVSKDLQKGEKTTDSVKSSQQHTISTTNTLETNSTKQSKVAEDEVDYFIDSNYIGALTDCGDDIDVFYESIEKHQNTEKTEKQEKVFIGYQYRCEKWFDFISQVDENKNNTLKRKAEKMQEQVQELLRLVPDEGLKSKAKNILNDSRADRLDTIALMYLLTQDWDFIKLIAKKVGTDNLNLITSNVGDITLLYESNFREYDVINQNQLDMFCLNDERACGVSVHQYLQQTLTLNQYNDLVNISQVIEELLREEYKP